MNDLSPKTIADYVAAANKPLTDPAMNKQIGSGRATFELYHFGLSVCSQKVRMTLFEKGAPFISHDINIFPPINQNYQPDYVRLRMQGGRGRDLVDGYTGRSSTGSEGFDPCVVPTLVDLDSEKVLIDSQAICAHIDAAYQGGSELIPARLKSEIEREIAIVDTSPHPAILYGAHPDGDYRPEMLKREMPGIYDRKIMKLMEGRSLSVGHPRLQAAYDAKIRKEAAAKKYVATDEMMRGALREVQALIAALDERLADGRTWICGEDFTMADIQWAISLFRFKWLGMAFLWTGEHALNETVHSTVAAYGTRLFARDSFQQAIIAWPTNPPTEFVMDHYPQNEDTGAKRATRDATVKGHGRDIREENLTQAVLNTNKNAPNPRAKQVIAAFARHLHAFLEEVQPTEQEWEYGIDFLTKTGHLSTGGRQEFILLSDVMGATARVDMINNRAHDGATENSVLGPFFVEDRPTFENGAQISPGIDGPPMFFNSRIVDTDGQPVAGARVDVWHSDDEGNYDIMMPGQSQATMRGLFFADANGRVYFNSVLPESYPIPDDGTVGVLLKAANRSIIRPAHVHVRIEAPGFRRLTTMLFLEGDKYLDSDPVFGVKQSLVMNFEQRHDQRQPDGKKLPSPCFCVDYDFVLSRAS